MQDHFKWMGMSQDESFKKITRSFYKTYANGISILN